MMRSLVLLIVLGASQAAAQNLPMAGAAVCPSVPSGLVVPAGIPPAARFYQRRIIMHLHEAWGLGRAPLVFAQVHQESGFRCEAESTAKARGLAQFIPSTAVLMHKNVEYAKQLAKYCADVRGCPFDPDWALRALVLLDREGYDRYRRASGDERYAFMLADYNGGVVWLGREIKVCEATPGCDATRYFGHVRNTCGRAIPPARPRGHPDPLKPPLTAQACNENIEYPRLIINELRPRYAAWLPPGL